MRRGHLLAAVVVSWAARPGAAADPVPAAVPDAAVHFEKKVRPVLAGKCVVCHGPDRQKGGLRVDSRAALLAGGDRGPAVVPGRPADSLLVRAIAHDGELKMPPKAKL